MAPMRRAACPSPGHLPSAQLRHARSRPRAAAGSRPCSAAHRRRATASPCGRAAPSDPTADAGPASAQVHGGRRGRSSGRSSRVRPASTHPSGALVSTTLRSARATSPAPTARAPASAAPDNSQAATVSGVSRAPTRHRRLRWPGSVADRRCGQSPVRPSAGSVRSGPRSPGSTIAPRSRATPPHAPRRSDARDCVDGTVDGPALLRQQRPRGRRVRAHRSRDQAARLTPPPPLSQFVLLLARERHTHLRVNPSRVVRSPIETAIASGRRGPGSTGRASVRTRRRPSCPARSSAGRGG